LRIIIVTEWPRLPVVALLLAATTAAAQAAAPESCSALAQFGAYDTSPALSETDRAESFRNWVCQANIALEPDLRLAATSLGISPEVLEATFGFDPNGSVDFLDWKHGLCATARSDPHAAEKLSDFVKGITPAATAALAACEAPPGLHTRLEATAKQCEFRIHFAWTPDKDASPLQAAPKDVQVIATNPHVACQPTALQTPFAVTGRTDLLCTRHDDTAMVVMVTAPSVNVTRLDHLMELPQALPDPQDLLAGDYQVEIAWRDHTGRFTPPTNDVWHLDLSTGVCRITGSGTAYSPRSAWFSQAKATCSPIEIDFTGYRAYDPAAKRATQFNLTLRSEDAGATFTGSGQDSLGNVAVQATARHRGEAPTPDQLVCKP
jgi:hypothetical protein